MTVRYRSFPQDPRHLGARSEGGKQRQGPSRARLKSWLRRVGSTLSVSRRRTGRLSENYNSQKAARRRGVSRGELPGADAGTAPGRGDAGPRDYDEISAVALGTGAPGLHLGGSDHWSPGLGAAFCLPGGPVAPARLLAGVRRLLRPGHCGLSRGHVSRLRGRRSRAAEPDPGGQSRLSAPGAALLTPPPAPIKEQFIF